MSNLNSTAVLTVAVVTLLAVGLEYFFGFKADPREPPVVKPTIPYIGHILGIIRHGNDYYRQLCLKNKLPIFTIPLLTSRAYIITDPDLAIATQRLAKTISFAPFVKQFSENILKADQRQLDLVSLDLVGPNADKGMVNTVTRDVHAAMAPGADLDEMNRKMLETLEMFIENVKPDENGQELDFYQWVRDLITIVSTDAFYGRENPHRDPKIAEAFWTFEQNVVNLALPGAKYHSKSAYERREALFRAYERYFDNDGHDTDGSAVIKARFHGHMRYQDQGVIRGDNARFEIGVPFALLANSVPSAFWTLLYAISDPELLAELRAELDAATKTEKGDAGTTTRILDISRMRDSCPTYLSLFQEVLRVHSTTILARSTIDNVVFANKYLLKKDSLVQMPAAVTHFQDAIWGEDCATFDPKRMAKRKANKENAAAGSKSQRLHPAGFRSFGAAPWLCPGRHFATTEILVFVAIMLAKYDIVPLNKDGSKAEKFVHPGPGTSILSSVLPPKSDIKVRLLPRQGINKNDKFKMIISEGGGSFPLPV